MGPLQLQLVHVVVLALGAGLSDPHLSLLLIAVQVLHGHGRLKLRQQLVDLVGFVVSLVADGGRRAQLAVAELLRLELVYLCILSVAQARVHVLLLVVPACSFAAKLACVVVLLVLLIVLGIQKVAILVHEISLSLRAVLVIVLLAVLEL